MGYSKLMITIYTEAEVALAWLKRYRQRVPHLACILGFTNTGLISGISAAGATPSDRQYTAIADAEFLLQGVLNKPHRALPPLTAGVSPVFITRAILESLNIGLNIFDAGLPHHLELPHINLGGVVAECVSTGKAMPLSSVEHLYQAGLEWGKKLVSIVNRDSYLVLGECVVGGTTTALALLMGLGIDAAGLVNSSHPQCNHQQKLAIVQKGLKNAHLINPHPLEVIAAVGDPMQIVVAGMAIAASSQVGILLAGGTQMLAVYALIKALKNQNCNLKNIVVGTTRWVAEDPSADTVKLAQIIRDVPLLATKLSFANSKYHSLRKYEEGFVKEGVAAGGLAIAANLVSNWQQEHMLSEIEYLIKRYYASKSF